MNNERVLWVGIGASAGGLEALKELIHDFKADNAIYIIAQHLDPKHPTILRDLLERSSKLPIKLVETDIVPEVGHIYIISPGHNAVINNKTIILTPAAPVGPKPSINEFFTSMASDIGENSIGVILSGTGSDGAQGVIALKSCGGIVFCQDEGSAKYSGMPRSAIETGVVDFILPPVEIAKEINTFIKSLFDNHTHLNGPKARSALEKIFQRLYDQTNYDFSGYKLKTIQRRIQRRMVVNKLITLDDYVTLMMSSPNEVESLFKELLISVTSFFRDPNAFDDLQKTIEEMIDKLSPGDIFRVWVPGCAKGEEAYSIAILIHEVILKLNKDVNYQIFATDIDDHALNLARQGSYTADQVRDIKPEIIDRYFKQIEDVYIVRKELRDQIVFAKQNVIMDPPFSHLDLVSCRNVLIYFNANTQIKVFQIFHFALKSTGYLFLGKSESTTSSAPDLFQSSKKNSQIFRRTTISISKKEEQKRIKTLIPSHQLTQAQKDKAVIQPVLTIQEKMQNTLLKKLIPAAVVINSMGHMLHVRGNLNRFLEIPEGRIDNNILSMAKDNLKIDIRSLMQRARRDGDASAQALFYQHEDNKHILYLSIAQIEGIQNEDLYVISFFDLDLNEGVHTGIIEKNLQDMSNEQLKQEVDIFRERLQNSIQDLETTNEEMQSTNEELQSANEELQSTNEELQTANEELQSTNEELSTVNEELEVKSFELTQVNSDLECMLYDIDEVIIFVDKRLRLKRYTRKAAIELDLKREDIGQIVTSLDLSLEIPNLRLELMNVIEKENQAELEFKTPKYHYNMRLVAYKAYETEVVGVIIFFERPPQLSIDNEQAVKFLSLFEQTCSTPFLYLSDRQITFMSQNLLDKLGYGAEEVNHLTFKEIFYQSNQQIEFDLHEHTRNNKGNSSLILLTKDKQKILAKYKVNQLDEQEHKNLILMFEFSG